MSIIIAILSLILGSACYGFYLYREKNYQSNPRYVYIIGTLSYIFIGLGFGLFIGIAL